MGNEWACDRIEELEAEAAELRATIAHMDATIRFLRDQYRTAVGLPTVPPERAAFEARKLARRAQKVGA